VLRGDAVQRVSKETFTVADDDDGGDMPICGVC